MARRVLSDVLLILASSTCATFASKSKKQSGNMNGEYMVASGDKFGVPFNSDYASKGHEYFDVYSPEIATLYAQSFWTDMGNNPLPDHIVKRFAGKVMAITGYEHDQVMVSPTGKPGLDPQSDVSVPINWAYNHHYMIWMTGTHSELKKVPAAEGDPMAHGAHTKNVLVDKPSAASRKDTSIPTSQMFSEGNGGESRKSFHGYPNGFAQLIESPTTWHVTPMQIDTRNRECGVTPADVKNCTKFTPGIEPRQARYGRGIPKDSPYSGILECPCTSRYGGDPAIYPDTQTKILTHEYIALSSGGCMAGQEIGKADDCFSTVPTLGFNATRFVNKSVSDPQLPPSCSVMLEKDGSATVYFNTRGHGKCAGNTKKLGEATSAVNITLKLEMDTTGLFERSTPGKYCQSKPKDLLKVFLMDDFSLLSAYGARDQCEKYCLGDEACWGCKADCASEPLQYGVLGRACQWNAVKACGEELDWVGSIEGDISKKQPQGGSVTITASGPADVWFGLGFDATRMADSPYTLVINSSGVIEQKIGTCGSEAEHCPGDQLESSVTVVSNTVENGRRTVVMTRGVLGKTKDHYNFTDSDQTINLITAVGQSEVFAYHKMHGPAKLSLTSVGSSTCVCDTGASGKLCETGGKNCGQFVKRCTPAHLNNWTGVESGDLLAMQNPTCNSRHYVGGLQCCHHKRILLDVDQEVPPELLRYHMKIRYWFMEYKPDDGSGKPSHYDLPRIYYQTEGWAGEYDIPPAFALPGHPVLGYPNWPLNSPTPGTTCTGTCPDGPDCDCVHTITYHWTVSNMRLIYAGGHCHAPACISLELYENSTGTPRLLCRQLPHYGKGNVTDDKFDENGYLALPPCLWSDHGGEGLEPSVWLPENTPLFSIKKNHNTHAGHFGEMASWQMRGVMFPPKSVPGYLV